jgi:hypothetical protein
LIVTQLDPFPILASNACAALERATAMPPTIRAIFSLDIWLLLLFSIRVGWSTPSMPDASRRLKYRLDIEMIARAYPA